MLSLGLRLPLSGSGCSPPASLPPVGHGPVCSQLALLWYSVSPLFCEQAWQCPRLELFVGKFSLFLFSLAIALSGLLSHVSSLRLPSGHSGPVLPLSSAARASLFSPRLLVVDPSVWATSPLGVAVRCVIWVLFIYFFFPVMLPSEIPKLPTDLPVRGFPDVWKLLLFYDSLPKTGLHP